MKPTPKSLFLENLWKEYVSTPSPKTQTKILEYYLPYIKATALNYFRSLPNGARQIADLGDFESEGSLIIWTSIPKFNPSQGFRFESFVSLRLLGGFKDLLRKNDPSSRKDRRRQREEGFFIPSTTSIDCGFRNPNRLGEESYLRDFVNNDEETPLQKTISGLDEIWDLISGAGLTSLEKQITVNYYLKSLCQAEIAKLVGLSESRVSQIHTRLLKKLRKHHAHPKLEKLNTAQYSPLAEKIYNKPAPLKSSREPKFTRPSLHLASKREPMEKNREDFLESFTDSLLQLNLGDIDELIKKKEKETQILRSLKALLEGSDKPAKSYRESKPYPFKSKILPDLLTLLREKGPLTKEKILESFKESPRLHSLLKRREIFNYNTENGEYSSVESV